jgi:hypothetical protein
MRARGSSKWDYEDMRISCCHSSTSIIFYPFIQPRVLCPSALLYRRLVHQPGAPSCGLLSWSLCFWVWLFNFSKLLLDQHLPVHLLEVRVAILVQHIPKFILLHFICRACFFEGDSGLLAGVSMSYWHRVHCLSPGRVSRTELCLLPFGEASPALSNLHQPEDTS